MSETRQTADLLDGLLIGDPMSEHHGVKCCPAIRETTDQRYILKTLSIPASQTQLDALLLTGAYSTPAHALEYFHELAQEVMGEVEILDRLSRLEGFLSFEGAKIRKMKNRVGYQVSLLNPYNRTLERQMQTEPLTHLGAVNLGLDLCAALAICRRAGYLYIDLKPTNIFLTPAKGWRIGDLGFVSLSTLKYASMPERYRSSYTAPEIEDAMSALNDTLDIYALGLVLYQVYNNGQLPFEGIAPSKPLAPPAYADYEMAEIILKACDPDPARRWADPMQMGQALVAYMQRNSINDTPIVPPPAQIAPEPEYEEPQEEPFLTEEENEQTIGNILEGILGEVTPPGVGSEPLPAIPITPVPFEAENGTPLIDIPLGEEELNSQPEEEAVAEALAEEAPAAEVTAAPEAEEVQTAASPAEAEESFLDDADETLPSEENAAELENTAVSEEVEAMLAQADELLAHELPEPAVAPDPIDIPFPAPIILEEAPREEEPAPSEEQAAPVCEEVEADVPAEDDVAYEEAEAPSAEEETDAPVEAEASEEDASEEDVSEEDASEEDASEEDASEEDASEEDASEEEAEVSEEEDEADDEEDYDPEYVNEYDAASEYIRISKPGKNKTKALVTLACCLVLLVALCVGSFLFYQYYYLQPVNSILIEGSVDSLSVQINSSIRDELLKVVCLDPHGIPRESEVLNGRAHFSNLSPDTHYRINLEISGFHKLSGKTSAFFTTSQQTEILNFIPAEGAEEGSVVLRFTVNGRDSDNWLIGYSTGNQPELTQSFTGHTVTINNLIVGNEYLFRLIPSEDQRLTGTWQVNYTIPRQVSAQELNIRSCADGILVAEWTAPDGQEGQEWNVRCYNDNGYDKTVTTTELQAQFVELDHAYGYTVEVTAVGMKQTASASVSANPITIKDITADTSRANKLILKWAFSGTAPANGWKLSYTVNGGEAVTLDCKDNTAVLDLYPGFKYEADVHPVDETTFYGKHFSFDAPNLPAFSGYGITKDKMKFFMCRTPNVENWDRFDLGADAYTSEFKSGEKASFLVQLEADPAASEDTVSISYLIYTNTETPTPVSIQTTQTTWDKMWNKRDGTLDIPNLPTAAGSYKVAICFNNMLVAEIPFTVK